MKLYDVIRKEETERGTPLPEVPVEAPRPPRLPSPPFRWRKVVIVGSAIAFLALLYIVGMRVVRAKVVVTERHIPFSLNNTVLDVEYDPNGTSKRLSFQTVVVQAEVTRQVYGSELQPSTSKAKGKVVIFNEYSTTTQTVKAKTVLTGANGKKYQTLETVSVPGYTLKGKTKSPGASAAVTIIATAVGPTFNSSGTDFTITGWSGSKAKQFYARSAGAITGGEDGVAHSVSDADRAGVIATLQTQLVERLKRETRTQIPESLVSFPDLQFPTIDNDSLVLSGPDINFSAKLKGSMVSYLIPRDLLERAIASRVLSDHGYPQVAIPGLAALSVVPTTAIPSDPAKVPSAISVKVSGQGTIITKAPIGQIQEALIGKRTNLFNTILSQIPEIDTARYHLYPFWAPFFPATERRITVTIQ